MTTTDSRTANLVAMPMAPAPSGSGSRPAKPQANPKRAAPGGLDSLSGQTSCDAHCGAAAEGQTSPQVNSPSMPTGSMPAGSNAAPPVMLVPTANHAAPEGRKTSRSHPTTDAHAACAAADDIPGGHQGLDIQTGDAAGEQDPPARATGIPPTKTEAPGLAEQDAWLAFAADILDDLERVRVANENRLRTLTSHGEDGFGLDEQHPDVARLAALVQMLRDAEHQAELNLCRKVRVHPLGPWIKRTTGIGEKQGARLLAAAGDPYWNTLHDRPRLVSELWSYCGYGDAAVQIRRRGQKSNWNAAAKMRAHLVAESCVKQRESPYRPVYDASRERYAEAVHETPCARCGPSGKPAAPGTPLSDGHKHARALRAVAKEILRDLWREARDIRQHDDTKAA